MRRLLIVGLVVTVVAAVCSPQNVFADDFRRKTKFWALLNAPMTAVVDGMPMRDALERIRQAVGINLCLDRQVDPTSPVKPGALGPTIFVALKKIAAERGCVVMPVCNVVLVGRPPWVDRTAASMLASEGSEAREDAADRFVNVSWPTLSTPAEALVAVAGDDRPAGLGELLPHDLWQEQKWEQIERNVATALVLAQCDLYLAERREGSSGRLLTEHRSITEPFDRMYSPDLKSSVLRKAISSHDRKSRAVVDDDILLVKATVAAHRVGTNALLTEFAKSVAASEPKDSKTFSLKRTQTSAGAALMQFAQAAGRKCIIEDDAVEACQKQITLEAKDETIKNLINRIAKKIDVMVVWGDQQIVVKAKESL